MAKLAPTKECIICGKKEHLTAMEATQARWSFSYYPNGEEYWRCPVCTSMWIAKHGKVSKAQQDTYGT